MRLYYPAREPLKRLTQREHPEMRLPARDPDVTPGEPLDAPGEPTCGLPAAPSAETHDSDADRQQRDVVAQLRVGQRVEHPVAQTLDVDVAR